jgi:hypothetical protein
VALKENEEFSDFRQEVPFSPATAIEGAKLSSLKT